MKTNTRSSRIARLEIGLWVALLPLFAACLNAPAPRGRFRPAGAAAVAVGYQAAYGPTTATATPRSRRDPVELRGHAHGGLVGGEAATFGAIFPSLLAARYQPAQACDVGVEAGWALAGADVRCALPGTAGLLALDVGARHSLPFPRLARAFDGRVALDLVKPSTAKFVPLVNLGLSAGRQMYLVSADVPGRVFESYELSASRPELRLEPTVGVTMGSGQRAEVLVAVSSHLTLARGTARAAGSAAGVTDGFDAGPVRLRHRAGFAVLAALALRLD